MTTLLTIWAVFLAALILWNKSAHANDFEW